MALYQSVFNPTQLAAIIAGSGATAKLPGQGIQGYTLFNRTGATVYIQDDMGHNLDIVPPFFINSGGIDTPTKNLVFVVLASDPVAQNTNYPSGTWEESVQLTTQPLPSSQTAMIVPGSIVYNSNMVPLFQGSVPANATNYHVTVPISTVYTCLFVYVDQSIGNITDFACFGTQSQMYFRGNPSNPQGTPPLTGLNVVPLISCYDTSVTFSFTNNFNAAANIWIVARTDSFETAVDVFDQTSLPVDVVNGSIPVVNAPNTTTYDGISSTTTPGTALTLFTKNIPTTFIRLCGQFASAVTSSGANTSAVFACLFQLKGVQSSTVINIARILNSVFIPTSEGVDENVQNFDLTLPASILGSNTTFQLIATPSTSVYNLTGTPTIFLVASAQLVVA